MNKLPLALLLAAGFACAAEPAVSDADWNHYAKDPAGTRYSRLDQIHRGNVTQLKKAWSYHAGNNSDFLNTTIECNPIIVKGVMYAVSPILDVVALDAATGREIWKYDPFPHERLGSTMPWTPVFATLAFAAGMVSSIVLLLRRRRAAALAIQVVLLSTLPLANGAGFGDRVRRLFPKIRDQERRQGPVRGLTYYENGSDRRIYFAGGARLVALNADSGKPLAHFGDQGVVHLKTGLERNIEDLTYAVTSPGVIYKDVYVIGVKVGEGPQPTAPGHIRAFDIHTGKPRWIFHTIPHPGEPGYETWPADAWTRAGGANAWGGLTVDHGRGWVFASTGSPSFDMYGGDRIGSNLYGNSVLAIDAETGKLVWHYQTVHHDVWDYDLPAPPSLAQMKVGSVMRDVAVQVGKNSFIFVLDRETGQPMFPVEERPFPASRLPGEKTWPTQPVPSKPLPLARTQLTEDDLTTLTPAAHEFALKKFRGAKSAQIYAPPSREEMIVTPGFHGGSNWSGAAFDPTRRMIVANSNDIPFLLSMRDARPFVSYRYGHSGFFRFRDAEGYPAVKPPWGRLTAIDLDSGDVVWKVPFGEDKRLTARGIPPTGVENAGGVIITAGGLIFAGSTNDEMFRAMDVDTGRVLWETKLNAGGYALPATYSINGQQFVVIASGGGAMPQTRSGDEYVAYSLSK